MRVLDLYAGLGGTARGIQSVLDKKGIKYEYIAIEIDPKVAEAHRKNNPESKVIVADALDWLPKIKNFDFVWASPPCKTHSQWNMVKIGRGEEYEKPDSTLWFLIREFRALKINYVIENVQPYYRKPLNNTFQIDRHLFWSNIPVQKFRFQELPKSFERMSKNDWQRYHCLETIDSESNIKKRQTLRNCTHYSIAAGIFEQFLEPKILGLEHFLKELPGAEQKA